jgi:hypothetical protein
MSMKVVLFVLLLSGLGACAELQRLQQGEGGECQQPEQMPGVVRWLEAAQMIRESSPDRQQQLMQDWEAAFQSTPALDTRMQLALIFAIGAEQLRDHLQARRLLNDIDPLPEAVADREFIVMLRQVLEDQSQSERKLAILWKQATLQNRRIEELEKQLRALTNIEKNIQNRDVPVVE